MVDFASQTWDEDEWPADGGGQEYPTNEFKRFWMPPDVTKRIFFLDGMPMVFWEHNMYAVTRSSKDHEVCLKRNKISSRGCPICKAITKDGKNPWPSLIGYFSVIDCGDVDIDDHGETILTGYTVKDGTVIQFQRKLYGAKRGGKDKPGVLKKLQRLVKKHAGNDLTGTVWDVYRSGEKTENVGDEFTFIAKIPRDQWLDYLVEMGADRERVEKVLEPVDYDKAFKPSEYDDLRRVVLGAGLRIEGVDVEDDIPFD